MIIKYRFKVGVCRYIFGESTRISGKNLFHKNWGYTFNNLKHFSDKKLCWKYFDSSSSAMFKGYSRYLLNIKALNDLANTHGLDYKEFIRSEKSKCCDDIGFHLKLADWSNVPRRRDYIYTYFKVLKYHLIWIQCLNWKKL